MSMDGATKTTPVQFIRFIRVMSSPFGLGGEEIPLPTASPSHLMLAPAALKASLSFFSQSLAAASTSVLSMMIEWYIFSISP